MAAGMKLLAASLALFSLVAAARAQALSDPMRPPSYAAAAGAADTVSGDPAQGGIVLQSIIVSAGRKLAVINGRAYRTGDRFGEARIAAISASAVTLRQAGKTRVITLLPDATRKPVVGEDKDKRASRKSEVAPGDRR